MRRILRRRADIGKFARCFNDLDARIATLLRAEARG
jgi:hypothetical protein